MTRLDLALVARGLARSRAHAQALITGGDVMLNDLVADKASTQVAANDLLRTVPDPYVSRGAHKLAGAFRDLGLDDLGPDDLGLDDLDRADPHGSGARRALDAGVSTGGFTQVLLERGWSPVYAIDVGTGQLAPVLRSDPRVALHERTNLRDLGLAQVDGVPVDLVVADVSFISLTLLVEPLAGVTRPDGRLLLLVKPQFEVGRHLLGSGGVVRDPALHRLAVESVCRAAARHGWHAQQCVPSRLPGAGGNREFFVLFERDQLPRRPSLNRTL